jgi:hypothetical protein
MTDEHLLPSHRDLGDAPARAPGTSRGIILAKLLWSFDMELTNEDVINLGKGYQDVRDLDSAGSSCPSSSCEREQDLDHGQIHEV